MPYKFSRRSLDRIEGIDADLVVVAATAILISKHDFLIPPDGGLRTYEDQKRLVQNGASRTMDSDHLLGKAIDVVPYINRAPSYHWPHYIPLAHAMATSARWHNIRLYWGGHWGRIDDARSVAEIQRRLGAYTGSFPDGAHFYIDR